MAPLQRVSLKSFLGVARAALKNAIQHSTPVTFVIGNESADLDSICSAILLAYLHTYTPSPSHSQTQQIHIPLSNLPSSDLRLRPELSPVLSKASLSLSDLLTLSDLPSFDPSSSASSSPTKTGTGAETKSLPQILKPELTRWLLVDHNALQADLGKWYGEKVVGCIDHHEDEHKVPKDTGDEPRVIQKSGSCASLVVEYCQEACDKLSSSSSSSPPAEAEGREAETVGTETESKTYDAQLAHLALAPILIDTGNLKTKSKVTPTDEQAVAYLESKLTSTSSDEKYNRDAYFSEITKAKEDIDHLSLHDILRKDYKQWTETPSSSSSSDTTATASSNKKEREGGEIKIGISSAVKPLSNLLSKPKSSNSTSDLLSTIHSFATSQNLSLYALMTTSTNPEGKFQRELLVWGIDERGVEAAERFERNAGEELGLVAWEGEGEGRKLDDVGGKEWRRAWVQGRVEYSRKQVGPLLRRAAVG